MIIFVFKNLSNSAKHNHISYSYIKTKYNVISALILIFPMIQYSIYMLTVME